MTPLTEDEKRRIAHTFLALQRAIDGGSETEPTYTAFRDAYRGDSRAYVDEFHKASDKAEWARQLRIYLEDEIGFDPEYWLPDYERHQPEG
jgi:hypothetical protein